MATVAKILNELSSVAHKKWRKIGIQIGISKHKVDEFAGEDESLLEVLDYWEKGNIVDGPKFCWESVVDVLKKSSVDENGLAGTIYNKYCKAKGK